MGTSAPISVSVNSRFSQNTSSVNVIKHNNAATDADVYVKNVFYQDGDLYLDLYNNAKATTFYINGKLNNSENNNIENIKYLIVLDSNNINMLVIPAENINYIEFNLTNGTTKSNDYIFYSVNSMNANYLVDKIATYNSNNNITIIGNTINQNSSASVIALELKKSADLSIDIFDLSGHKISNLANANYPAGRVDFKFTNNHLANGIYICRLSSQGNVKTFKFINKN